jgi:hypothetical protein
MAGKSQHHVWQHIQRGFGVKRGKHFHIWVYQKDQKAYLTGTHKYGTVGNFLSEDSDTRADEILTAFENEIQGTIHSIRQMDDRTVLASDTIAPIVTHLEMRSLFLRTEMSRLGERLLSGITEIFSSEKNLKKLI